MNTDYDKRAEDFLQKHGIKFSCKLGNDKSPAWNDGEDKEHGNHYRITLAKSDKRITFDYWGSIHDRKQGITTERAYSVLACLSSDVNIPETFADFCRDFGYDRDSMTANRTFKRCAKFCKRLRAFFTAAEIADLQEIQ